ncbi:hypothetical protein FP568_13460 [Pandoraea pnomenusa]|uniref:hypothetical protein n=1 Tax=Pandoraea pnomenusa TaxID=93220 RepID=UPI0011989F6E|nr:hypothetical protein [Pandoraea pnomenusa]QDX22164.1 hypothetical protein FP568_13460 [Pandoraea pnomenusa]
MEPDLIERLAEALAERIAPAVPLHVQLWSAKSIAGYLQRSPAVVMERVVTLPGFPRPIRLPAQREGSKGQPLWKAAEVIAWAESHRDKLVGRARRAD